MTQSRRTTAPLLVTGMPRSGTTWLARLLSTAPRTALTGREPMNPRGRQYALAGTLTGWARLEEPTPRQARALRSSYRGLNPMVYSRYGHRQWAAALPGVRVVVKDPFAMLSIPAVHQVTRAHSVLLFRHPGAALTSYRRMGWSPDLTEVAPVVEAFRRRYGQAAGVQPLSEKVAQDEVRAMAWFWNVLYGMALHDVHHLDSLLVVAHHEVASGGGDYCRGLFNRLGLAWDHRVADHLRRQDSAPAAVNASALHNFDRPPAEVAQEWASKLAPSERHCIEGETAEVYALLSERSFRPKVGP